MSDRLKEIRERHTEFGTGCDLEIHCDACYLLAQLAERDALLDRLANDYIDEACDLHLWALQVALDYRKLKEGR